MLVVSYDRPLPDFQRVSDGRHTSGPIAIFLLVYDIAINLVAI